MREIARGFFVNFERFKEMINELGYEEHTYKDPMGVVRYQFKGLEVVETTVEGKWGLKKQNEVITS